MEAESDKSHVVKVKIGERYLKMPKLHKLPQYYMTFPFYDRALSRIARKIKDIDGCLNFIDVGANIGDTVSLITDTVEGSFLCIEGDAEYLPFLKENLRDIGKSVFFIEECYCHEKSYQDKIRIHREGGTTRLEEGNLQDENDVNFKSLDDIVKIYPEFKKTNILKIDTDGFEINVLKGGRELIKNSAPVIFFEFDPDLYLLNNKDPKYIFDFLHENNYMQALVYNNFGVPIKIIETSDKNEIKKLCDLVDKKKIYYFDILTFHTSKKDNYKKLFQEELLSSLSLFDKVLDSTNTQLEVITNKFNLRKEEILALKSEREAIISKLNSKINELNSIYYSRGWRFLMYLRKVSIFIMPKKSLRTKAVSFVYHFFKKTFKLFVKSKKVIKSLLLHISDYICKPKNIRRKINRNSRKIVYVGHSYHKKTKSTNFLIDYLGRHFEVEEVQDESWLGKPFPDLSFVDESYLGVIFFQLLPPKDILKSIKNDNIIYFPMYDYFGRTLYADWINCQNIKIINFSRTLHEKLKDWGFDSMYIQFFPKPKDFILGDSKKIFFWQRLSHINIKTVSKLFEGNKFKIHLHKAIDPGQEFVQPNKMQESEYGITYSDWFEAKDDMIKLIEKCGIYVAPRQFEGIGMSFLEAMAMGKAVVTVDNPTMNEYIQDGFNGYLFDLNKPEKIDLSNMEDVQKNSHDYIRKGYEEWEVNKIKIIDFIKK